MPALLRRLLLSALLGVLTAGANAQQRAYVLEAPGDLRGLLERHLPPNEAVGEDLIERLGLSRRLRRQIPELLATEGYFSPRVDITTEGELLRVQVEPGPRAVVRGVKIDFAGALAAQPRFAERAAQLRAAWSLREGEAFRQEDWTAAKEALLQSTITRDFPAAVLADTLADVDPKTASVLLTVTLNSGPAYTLGRLQVEGLSEYNTALVERYNRIEPGEPYDFERLLSLQSTLQNTPYFSAVDVSVDTDSGQHLEVPIRVRLAEAKPKRATAGVGYSSNTGGRLELGYQHANWLGRAWQLSTGLRLDQRAQAASADVFLPPARAGHVDSFGGIVERSEVKGLQIARQAVGAARRKPRGNIETRIGLSLQREQTRIDGGPPESNLALALNWSWTQRKVDNLLDPRRGYVLNFQLGGASRYLLSDTDFFRGYLRASTYWPIGQRDVLHVRGEIGHTLARRRRDVPQEFLFRTGGAQTVRGYGYLGLGVQEGGAVVGGRFMGLASVEYTHWRGQWGYAAFVDAGNAVDQPADFRAKLGLGGGVRWKSPAGPLAFDLAYGVGDRKIRPHISIAIAF